MLGVLLLAVNERGGVPPLQTAMILVGILLLVVSVLCRHFEESKGSDPGIRFGVRAGRYRR